MLLQSVQTEQVRRLGETSPICKRCGMLDAFQYNKQQFNSGRIMHGELVMGSENTEQTK